MFTGGRVRRFERRILQGALGTLMLMLAASNVFGDGGPGVPLEPQQIQKAQAFGLDLVGNVSYSFVSGTARLRADQVRNSRSTGVSGTLRLGLWFTTQPPVFGQSFTGYLTATDVLGSLSAGLSFFGVDSGVIPWSRPPDGTYYVTMTLDEFQTSGQYTYADFFTFSNTQTIGSPCTANSFTLCLGGGRFRVTVNWSVPPQGTSGAGQVVQLTSDTAAIWFFTSQNYELLLKIVDGRVVNGRWWFFSGPLTNVQYTIAVTDTSTGVYNTYTNLYGQVTPFQDVSTFQDVIEY